MGEESANQALRSIRTLYAVGAVGGLTDGELLERFLGRSGIDREDAFAALVRRHGPMVLKVCRRMLPGSADAEDAFQAVFLVLARKAGAVRRVDKLKPWLYGVAVRTAKEALRRSATRRAREGAAVDESRAVSAPDEGKGELLALLDEEIDRLPSRYREPLILCELEGASRQAAARQLGLPEGTLSSRLSRGRSLLRDRLARRQIAVGAGLSAALISEAAGAALPEPLADSTVRLALDFGAKGAAAGTVPAAVASLAEGVLAMIAAAKLKLILVATTTLGAAVCLTAGLAWAVAPNLGAQPPDAKAPAVVATTNTKAAEREPTPRQVLVRGVVVDEAGRPVAGAEVRAETFAAASEARGISGSDGSFAFPIERQQIDNTALIARSPDGGRVGLFRYGYNLTKAAAEASARIVVKPGREVVVRVTDAAKTALAGAAVEAAGNFTVLDDATTGPDGTARLRVPADAKVEWIVALKPGRGFDYAEFGAFDDYGRSKGGVLATNLPGTVALTLEAPRTCRIKAVDTSGKPLAGVGFTPWLLQKDGRRSQVNFSSRIFKATTGPDGVATFDWLPPAKGLLQFWPVHEGYAQRRVILEEGATGPVTAKLTRNEAIRGRVVRPDGSPARDVLVHAFGTGKAGDNGRGQARTAADGSYEISVSAGEGYSVFVEDKDWTAPARLDVIVREAEPAEGVDFKLSPGTVVRGTVTVSPGPKPAPDQYIMFDQTGGQGPIDVDEEGHRTSRQIRRQFGATTDANGRYSIRVGPGSYTLVGPPRTTNEKITVKDEAELVRDFQMPRPGKGPISGRVVLSGKGVAGATVEIFAANTRSGVPFTVKTDAEGRFQCERSLDKSYVCAKSSDGSLGAIVEIGAEDPEVVIEVAPTATATGLLLDLDGKPAANVPLAWGRRIYLDDERRLSTEAFAPKVKTDAEGRFTLPALVVGQEYNIALERKGTYHAAGVVRPESAAPIDLGTLRAGAYRPKSLASAEEESSFLKDAPGAGTVAPPIDATTLDGKPVTLADFKGKYVLLDFWATWCGPCIGEIPQLQGVHDAFGKDERFAILSLSVDEKVEEPRAFQEKRKLPWSQAFLGGGIHSATPGTFGIRAIPAFVLVGPDGKIVARGMRGDEIKKEVARALAKR
jgi:RNA polymerase sigma factor (sigma-70 family)